MGRIHFFQHATWKQLAQTYSITVSMSKLKDFTDLCVRGIKTQAIKHQHHHQQQEYWQTFISNKSASGRITKLCVSPRRAKEVLSYITSHLHRKTNEAMKHSWAWCSLPCLLLSLVWCMKSCYVRVLPATSTTSSQARSREMWVTAVETSGIPGQGLGSL